MKRFFIALILAVVLASCNDYLPSDYTPKGYNYTVTQINKLTDSRFEGRCLYFVSGSATDFDHQYSIMVIDSIGRFAIGDRVYFKLEHLKE